MIVLGTTKIVNRAKNLEMCNWLRQLYLTLQLLAPKLLCESCRLRLPNYVELTSKCDPQRSSIDHTAPHRLDQNHPIPIQTIPFSQKRIPDRLQP
jgi:hypothetical protein